jgi:hypothetical protein
VCARLDVRHCGLDVRHCGLDIRHCGLLDGGLAHHLSPQSPIPKPQHSCAPACQEVKPRENIKNPKNQIGHIVNICFGDYVIVIGFGGVGINGRRP